MKLNKTTVVLLAAGLLTTAVRADEKGRGPGKGRPEARGKGGCDEARLPRRGRSLLYTTNPADEGLGVDLCGRRIIKKK